MNSLELIKSEIYEANANLEKFTKLLKNEPEHTSYSFYVTYFSNRLTILQQIKLELEAWEEIKKYLVLNEGCIYEDSYYEYLTLQNDCIDETESEEQGVSLEIIKKALEVK